MNGLHLPTRDSATGRGIATFVQTVLGFVLGLYAIPGVKEFVGGYIGVKGAVTFSAIVGLISLVNNLLRSEVPNY